LLLLLLLLLLLFFCNCTIGGGPNQIAMYDYNRVLQAGNPDIQPTTRFLGHSDVVTAVAAGEREFKDCFLSGELAPLQVVCTY
jgi:hypothetical protein